MGKKDQYAFMDDSEEEESDEARSDDSTETLPQDTSSNKDDSPENTPVVPENGVTQTSPSTEIDLSNLPLKQRRDSVKEFRTGVTFFIQDETEDAIEKVNRFLNDEFTDEKLHKLDLYEIIILNGIFDRNGDIDEEGIRRQAKMMGYGLK